jgi:hypothetical protein
MSTVEQKFLEHKVEPEGLPIGVSIDGKVIPPARVLELAEQHFDNEVKDAKGAVGHEWLSMVPSTITVVATTGASLWNQSIQPLADYWGSPVALFLSAPILYSLYQNKFSAEHDQRRVQRLKSNFNKTQDPKVLHALDFQLEGYEDLSPQRQCFDSDDRVDAAVETEDLSRAANRVTAKKSHCTTKTAKAKEFFVHTGKDVGGVLQSPKVWTFDMGDGWLSVGKQVCLLAEHANMRFGQGLWNVKESVFNKTFDLIAGKKPVSTFNDVANENIPPLSEEELENQVMVEHEANRLEKAKAKLVKSMSWSGPSFVLENGFIAVESFNGVRHLQEGNTVMGLAHLFSAAMALRPAQVLALDNKHAVNNFTSPRSRSAGRQKIGKPPVPTDLS